MQNKKTETKIIDKRIRLLVKVLSKFPGFEIISSDVGYKINDSSSDQICYSEFFVIFNCRDYSSFKIIPIIDRFIAHFSDDVTLERENDFEDIIKNRIKPGDTMWTL
jgi:hypothetical protein